MMKNVAYGGFAENIQIWVVYFDVPSSKVIDASCGPVRVWG